MQLVAYGAQDIYLTGNPQITFFKVVYRRHTNFSMEHIQQTFKGTPGSGARVVATVSRNGDLVHDCYIKFNCNQIGTNNNEVNNPGHALINNVEVEIGGQSIDKQYGHFMEAHAELTEKNYGLVAKQGNSGVLADRYGINATNSELSPFQQTAGAGGVSVDQDGTGCNLYVPLRFWFCRHVGLSLPLIALQYHEVNINVTFSGGGVYNTGDAADHTVKIGNEPELWVNYIYLDTDERRRFAQVSHEYLIEQVQQQDGSVTNVNKTFKLNFNHPVKELIWVGLTQGTDVWGGSTQYANDFVNWGTTTKHKLILNGHDRFAEQDLDYFTRYQSYKYHRNLTRSQYADSIAVYSFALKPEEHQPSGTCNFSRIDSAQLEFTSPNAMVDIFIYAINYNVLRIMSGMGGLAYSN